MSCDKYKCIFSESNLENFEGSPINPSVSPTPEI